MAVPVLWLVLALIWGGWHIVHDFPILGFGFGWMAFMLVVGAAKAGALVALVTFLPTLAVTTRRLHDTGRSGWWQALWYFAPAPLWLLLLYVLAYQFAEAWGGADPSPAPLFIIGGLSLAVNAAMGVWALVLLARPGDPFQNSYGKPQ